MRIEGVSFAIGGIYNSNIIISQNVAVCHCMEDCQLCLLRVLNTLGQNIIFLLMYSTQRNHTERKSSHTQCTHYIEQIQGQQILTLG